MKNFRSPAALFSTMCVLTACSGGGGGGAIPTPTPAAPQTILVTDEVGAPRAGVPVVVNDSSGSIVASTVSSSAGTVTAHIPTGGSFSVFDGYGTSFSATTYFDVPGGATVTVGTYGNNIVQPTPVPTSTPAVTTFNITLSSAPAGANYAVFLGPCGGNDGNAIGSFTRTNAGCTTKPTYDFLFIAENSATGAIMGWGNAFSIAAIPGGSIAVGVSVDQPAFDTVAATIDDVNFYPDDVRLEMSPVSIGPQSLEQIYFIKTTAPQSTALSYPSGFASSYGLSFYASRSSATSTESTDVSVARYVSFTAAALPATSAFHASDIATISDAASDLSNPEQPILDLVTDAGNRGDVGQFQLEYFSGLADIYREVYFDPNARTRVTLPQIPDSLSSFRPLPTTDFGSTYAAYIDYDDVDGWGDYLAAPPSAYTANNTSSCRHYKAP